ncbi:hypothetical protein Tcan_00797, partial [Toxocara canis]
TPIARNNTAFHQKYKRDFLCFHYQSNLSYVAVNELANAERTGRECCTVHFMRHEKQGKTAEPISSLSCFLIQKSAFLAPIHSGRPSVIISHYLSVLLVAKI